MNPASLKIEPSFKEKNIAIALACNEKYLIYTVVAIQSILDTSSLENNYDILILVQENFEPELKTLVIDIVKGFPNFSIRFVNVSPFFKKSEGIPVTWLDLSTYNRLVLPSLYQGSQILYLDSDILVQEDIAGLYQINLENYLCGAVKDCVLYVQRYERISYPQYEGSFKDYTEEYLKLKTVKNYFNAGICFLNLDKIREHSSFKKLLDFNEIQRINPIFHDQDWLNLLFEESVFFLDEKWNQLIISEASNKGIFHYAGSSNKKPWNHLDYSSFPYFSEWWRTAQKISFYPYIHQTLMNQNLILLEKRLSLRYQIYQMIIKSIPISAQKILKRFKSSYRKNGLKVTIGKIFSNLQREKIPTIPSLKEKGITSLPRSSQLIITLTSHPGRIKIAHLGISTLLLQDFKPNQVILWLNENEFPHKEKELPKNLLRLKKYGLTLKWTNQNIKSFKKLIPTLKEYPNSILVTADDDTLYPSDWLKMLYQAYQENPKDIHAHRIAQLYRLKEKWGLLFMSVEYYKEPSFLNFLENVGGVLYPPNSFYKDVTEEKLFMHLSPTNDDVWIWAMAVLNNTKIKFLEKGYPVPQEVPGTQGASSLSHQNVIENNLMMRDFKQVLNYYPELQEKLLNTINGNPEVAINKKMIKMDRESKKSIIFTRLEP